jgi:hypothetical protein
VLFKKQDQTLISVLTARQIYLRCPRNGRSPSKIVTMVTSGLSEKIVKIFGEDCMVKHAAAILASPRDDANYS